MQLRKFFVVVGAMLSISACAQSPRFMPMVDAGSAAREAREQSAMSSQFRGGLTDRLRQMHNGEVITDVDRSKRVQPVVERLFAAAAPFCPNRCSMPIMLDDSQGLNAHADSRRISISRPMIDLADTKDQLALVLGHELAHVLLGHTHRDAWTQFAAAFGDSIERDDERQADYVGLYLAARAGYDTDKAVNLWRRMGAVQPRIIAGDATHPGTAERFVALRNTAAEIAAKKRAGQPLMPNQQLN